MRRWRPLSRFFHARGPRDWDRDRCILVVEQLESREVLSPVVISPSYEGGLPQVDEGGTYTYSYYEAFYVYENSEEFSGHTFRATLTGVNGTVTVNPASGVTVTGNGTGSVVLTGLLDAINNTFSNGYTLDSKDFFSGDAAINLRVTDLSDKSFDTGSAPLQVLPVVSDVGFGVNAGGEVFTPSSGFNFPATFIAVSNWPDSDGSERLTVSFLLDAPNPGAFQLFRGGSPVTPLEDGFWQVSATNPTALRALIDSLTLVPPGGFTGRATLTVFGNITDAASYSDGSSASQSTSFPLTDVALRFFQGGSVSLPAAFAQEGGTIDLGGRYAASDPDELPGDTHQLTLFVPGGTLALDPAASAEGVSVDRSVGPNGGTTITLTGSIAAINSFLATPGCMTYTAPSATFGGVVPLTVTLRNFPGPNGEVAGAQETTEAPLAFTGVAPLAFVPAVERVFPFASSVVTNEDTPVALSLGVSSFADADGSQSVLLIVGNMPAGSTLNHGTSLGGGQWALSLSDLTGLVFTPPSGGTGVYSFTLTAVATDSPGGVTPSTASESTTFTVTVIESDDDDDGSFGLDDEEEDGGSDDDFDTDGNDSRDGGDGPGEEGRGDEGEGEGRGGENHDPVRAAFAGYTGGPGGPGGPNGAPDPGAGRFSPAALAAPFPQADGLQVLYGGGEKHPLPPVLPLDQSLPGAGFTDSGGDSFALIDLIYRDAAGKPPTDAVTILDEPAPDTAAVAATSMNHVEALVGLANVGAANDTPDGGSGEAAAAEASASDWRPWAGATVITGAAAAAAWVWLARGPKGFPRRAARWLLRALHRRPTERTA
jgi:hypothetical protein